MGSSQALLETAFTRGHVSMSPMPGLAVLLLRPCRWEAVVSMTDGTHCSKAKLLQIKKLSPKWIPSVEDIKSSIALVGDG